MDASLPDVGALSSQVVAALVAGIVSLLVSVISAFVAKWRAGVDEKIAHSRGEIDQKIAKLKGDLDKELAEQKNRLDNKTIFAAERVAHELMIDPKWTRRSFRIISHHLGGFKDDDLRQILVRAGAIRVTSNSGEELWGLLERNRPDIGVEQLRADSSTSKARVNEQGEIQTQD